MAATKPASLSLVLALLVGGAATAFVVPSSAGAFGSTSSKGRYQESAASPTRIESTYAEPQTFSKTNFGLSDPLSYGPSSLALPRRRTSPAVRGRTSAANSMNDFVRGTSSSSYSSPLSMRQREMSTFSPLAVPVTVHGGGVLRTWSFEYDAGAEVADVYIQSVGSPVDASVELWEGPNYAPVYVRTYSQDGGTHPLSLKMLLDESRSSSLAVRNTGPDTFPLQAVVSRSPVDNDMANMLDRIGGGYEDDLQGGASLSYPIDPAVEQTQLLLRTEGRPLNVRIELMQGPSNNKVVSEIQSMDGTPLVLSFETPGYANVIRVINLSPLEFPIIALVDPSHIDQRNKDQYGNSQDFLRGTSRRDRFSQRGGSGRGGSRNGYSSSSSLSRSSSDYGGYNGGFGNDDYSPRTNNLGFRSGSMNRSAATGNRVLASELNRSYAAPVQHGLESYKTPVATNNKVMANSINRNYGVASELGRNYMAPVQQGLEPYKSTAAAAAVSINTNKRTGRFGSVTNRSRNPILNKNVPGSSKEDLLSRSSMSASTTTASSSSLSSSTTSNSEWWSS